MAFGYENEVVYPVRAEIRPGARSGSGPRPAPEVGRGPSEAGGASLPDVLHITADLDYLVCQVDCVPFRYTLTLDQPLGDAPDGDPATATLRPDLGRASAADRARDPRRAHRRGARRQPAQGGPDLEIRVLGVKAQDGQDRPLPGTPRDVRRRPAADATPSRMAWSSTCRCRRGRPASRCRRRPRIAWTVSNLTAKDGKPFNLEARREVRGLGRGGRRAGPDAGAGGRPDGGRLPRQLLRAFLGGALMNLAPTVLALLIAAVFSLRLPGTGLREAAAAAVTGVVGGCWAVAGLALLAPPGGAGGGLAVPAYRSPACGALLAIAAALLALNLWGLLELPLPAAGAARAGSRRHLLAGLSHRAAGARLARAPAPGADRLRLRARAGGGLRRLRDGRLRPRPSLSAPHAGAGWPGRLPVSGGPGRGPGCPACARGSASSPAAARSGCSMPSPAG